MADVGKELGLDLVEYLQLLQRVPQLFRPGLHLMFQIRIEVPNFCRPAIKLGDHVVEPVTQQLDFIVAPGFDPFREISVLDRVHRPTISPTRDVTLWARSRE